MFRTGWITRPLENAASASSIAEMSGSQFNPALTLASSKYRTMCTPRQTRAPASSPKGNFELESVAGRILQARGPQTPRFVRRRLIELDALFDQVAVRRVDIVNANVQLDPLRVL